MAKKKEMSVKEKANIPEDVVLETPVFSRPSLSRSTVGVNDSMDNKIESRIEKIKRDTKTPVKTLNEWKALINKYNRNPANVCGNCVYHDFVTPFCDSLNVSQCASDLDYTCGDHKRRRAKDNLALLTRCQKEVEHNEKE